MLKIAVATIGPEKSGRVMCGVVMKIEGEGEHRGRRGLVHLLFRNVRVGPQDIALFEPPTDFRRLPVSDAMLDSVLKGMEQLERMRGGTPPRQ